jgi:hypothetical protein
MPASKTNWLPIAKRLGYEDERSMLVDLYKLLGGVDYVARAVGYSNYAVTKRMNYYGILRKKPGRKPGFVLNKEN